MVVPQYLLFFISFIVLVADQLSKFFIHRSLYFGQSIPIVKNIFHFSLVHNSGIAFGLFKNQTIFFIILSIIVIIYILSDSIFHLKQYTLKKHIALGLILGGALGNLLDRIRLGCVVDFLDFRVWPVFNIADSSITIGMVLLGWSLLREPKRT